MANGKQMKFLIKQATDEVMEKGVGATDKEILLAGFGYLAEQLDESHRKWYKRFGALFLVGGAAAGVGGGTLLSQGLRLLGL